MYRRCAALEAWERSALREYAHREGWGAVRRVANALEAERLTRQAHALLRGSARSARRSARRLYAVGTRLGTESRFAASRMEYRLVALFAE